MTLTSTRPVQELVRFARGYQKHYANLPEQVSELSEIPVLDHSSFWSANTGVQPENRVLTAPLIDGTVFRWRYNGSSQSLVSHSRRAPSAACLVRASLQPGDRVANMRYGGDLYKCFLDLGIALIDAAIPDFHLSIGFAPLESQAWRLRTYAASVLLAMPNVRSWLPDY